LVVTTIAIILLVKHKPREVIKKKVSIDKRSNFKSYFSIQFAVGAFVLYLLLLLLRLLLFIDMYTVSPVILMVEFTVITIVALMLFVPYLIDRIGREDEMNEYD